MIFALLGFILNSSIIFNRKFSTHKSSGDVFHFHLSWWSALLRTHWHLPVFCEFQSEILYYFLSLCIMFSNFQSRFSANCSMLFWEKGDNFCGFQSLSHWIWSLLPLLQTACPQMPYSVGSGAECRMGNNWTEHDALSTQVERVVFDVFPALGLLGRRDPSPFGPKCLSPLTRKFYFWTCVCPSSSHVIALRSSPILTCFRLWAAFTSSGSFFFFFTYNHTWSFLSGFFYRAHKTLTFCFRAWQP